MSIFACYLLLFPFLKDQFRFPLKFRQAPFRIKKLNILPLDIYIVRDYSLLGSTADFVKKKDDSGFPPGFGHLHTSDTSGRNMAVELDSRHPLLPKTG